MTWHKKQRKREKNRYPNNKEYKYSAKNRENNCQYTNGGVFVGIVVDREG